jgi:hypothetical protein
MHLERSVSVLQQQHLSSHSRICGAVGRLKKTQENTSTTLLTKASSVIVQRRECAGPNLDRARGASLDTKESHNTPSESKQKHKEQPLSFSFSLLLFFFFRFFFFFCFFFSFLFRGIKSFVCQPKQNDYCIQPLPTQNDKSYFRQPDAQISKSILECSDEVCDQGQIRWKEHELSSLDCLKFDTEHRNYSSFLPGLN